MNKHIPGVFEWFAQENTRIAEQANEPKRRETFANLALLWAIMAVDYRGHNPPSQGAVRPKLHGGWREWVE